MKKFNEISLDQLSMVQGGGEPVPGAEIYLEQEPEGEPDSVANANAIDAAPASGSYNSSRSNVAN
jgi:hypothetical protein